jgi:hypothetical protein
MAGPRDPAIQNLLAVARTAAPRERTAGSGEGEPRLRRERNDWKEQAHRLAPNALITAPRPCCIGGGCAPAAEQRAPDMRAPPPHPNRGPKAILAQRTGTRVGGVFDLDQGLSGWPDYQELKPTTSKRRLTRCARSITIPHFSLDRVCKL